MSQANSKAVLDRETDARFWAQTQYKSGQRLDPTDPTDRAMMRVWLDIFAKVQREDRAGHLTLTYNHPVVERSLDDARLALHAAAAHLEAAVQAPDPVRAQQHAEAAATATTTASSASQAAAALQPATVSPAVVTAAATEAATAAALPPPARIVESLPPDHPAVSSLAAQPVLPPQVATAPAGRPPQPPAMPGRPFAVAQAVSAPGVSVAVHEAAQARADQGAPPPTGTLPPQTIAELRDIAIAVAEETHAPYVGVTCSPQQQWSWLMFPSLTAAADWYGTITDSPELFVYAAYYDQTSDVWPQPINEVFGTGQAITVTARPEREGMSGAMIAVLAALGVAGIAALASASSRKGQP